MTGSTGDEPFSRAVVDRVTAHMNACHQAENLLLARQLGRLPEATAAWAAGFDADGFDLIAEVDSGPVVLRLQFGRAATSVDAVRHSMMLEVAAGRAA
jgi:putative heme iron utilization protein